MKTIILSIFILASVFNADCQIKVQNARVISGNTITFDPDIEWSSNLQNYTDSLGFSISRSSLLNEHANRRAEYFAGLLNFNSMDKRLKESMNSIPDGSASHTRYFGNPEYFKEPDGSEYVNLHTTLKKGSIEREIRNEIMQECFYSVKSEKAMDYQELILKSISAHKKKKGNSYILKKYVSSPSHKSAIHNSSNTNYGTSSCFIVHQWFDSQQNVWINEVLIVNVTLFS